MQHAIVCKELYKRYESGAKAVDAVNGLDLEVRVGECFGLLGPNGAGKTTTVEILEGLLKPTAGDVEVLGIRWGQGRDHELRQKLGISLQETKLQEKLTVVETLRLFRSFYDDGLEPEEVIRLVSLEDKTKVWVRKLSGGQRQRLAVACALVGKPELLFLDEPTTGLDPQARRQVWDIVNNLTASGKTILLTTHYMDEAEKLCDRVAIVNLGKIIALGTPRELIAQMGSEHVIEFGLVQNGQLDQTMPPERFLDIPSVRSAVTEANGYVLSVSEPHLAIPALLECVRQTGLELSSLTTRHINLEDVFVGLTGKHLDEDNKDA